MMLAAVSKVRAVVDGAPISIAEYVNHRLSPLALLPCDGPAFEPDFDTIARFQMEAAFDWRNLQNGSRQIRGRALGWRAR